MPVPNPTPIYHITHIENLPLIIKSGGLWSNNQLRRMGMETASIAYQHIQDRRETRQVPVGPGGNLHDYIPFYFAPRSPMLYTISRGNVAGVRQQSEIIYLVSTVQSVWEAGCRCVFTDGHAVIAYTQFYERIPDLEHVNWELMSARDWYDTLHDMDRKRRRQAEFLVHNFFSWRLVIEIGVMNRRFFDQVTGLVEQLVPKPAVNLRQNWYY